MRHPYWWRKPDAVEEYLIWFQEEVLGLLDAATSDDDLAIEYQRDLDAVMHVLASFVCAEHLEEQDLVKFCQLVKNPGRSQ